MYVCTCGRLAERTASGCHSTARRRRLRTALSRSRSLLLSLFLPLALSLSLPLPLSLSLYVQGPLRFPLRRSPAFQTPGNDEDPLYRLVAKRKLSKP